jgi:hypothetical protein
MTRDQALTNLRDAIKTGDTDTIRAAYQQLAAEHRRTADELLLNCAVNIRLDKD